MRKAKLLGGVTIVLHRGAGAYICGEETALLESLEGKRGQPRTKPPFPAIAGLYASPSLINNVETISTVPKIIELGAKEYAKIGVPPDSSGTRVFSLSGNVVNGGNYELPMGVTLRELIYDFGGGISGRARAEGGHPGRLVGARADGRPDRRPARRALDGRGRVDARLGRDHRHRRPLLHGAARPPRRAVLHARELRQVHAVPRGHALDGADPRGDRGGAASQSDLDLLLDVCDRILGKCLCPLGDAAAMPVASYIDKFRAEFQEHIEQRLPDARRVVARARPRAGRPAHAPPVAEVPA